MQFSNKLINESNAIYNKNDFETKEYIKYYKDFINKNKIKYNNVELISSPFAYEEEITTFVNKLNENHEKNNYHLNLDISLNNKKEINNIKFCNSFKDILLFDINKLINIRNFILDKDKIIPNIINIKNNNGHLYAISAIFMQKNSFITNAIGIYGYKKDEKVIAKNNSIIKKHLLFKCKDDNYSRYFYYIKSNDISSIFTLVDKKEIPNVKLYNYLDFNLKIKVGLFTTKDIPKGDKFILY